MANSGQMQDGNVVTKWQYSPLSDSQEDGGIGVLDLFLEDANSHKPVDYRSEQLAAWLRPHRNALSDSEQSCRVKLRMLTSQGIGQRAENDLNGWRLVTLNHDRTLAFINPFVGINQAKLESIITLPGDIDSWLQQSERLKIWLHVQDDGQSRLLSVDTQRRKLDRSLVVPPGPGKLLLDGDGRHLWLLATDSGRLGVLDGGDQQAQIAFAAANGATDFTTSPVGGVYAWGSDSAKLQFWQMRSNGEPEIIREWTLPAPVFKAEWSQQAQRLLVALGDGSLLWLNPDKAEAGLERVLKVGGQNARINDFALFDEGRRLLWLDAQAARAGVVDVATGRELLQTEVVPDVDGIVFSENFAYLHSTGQGKASLLALADIRAGRAQPVEITAGRPAEGVPAGRRLAADPSGHGILIANPADGVVYQYAEGMMAPMGSYSNYRRAAVGVMVLDTGLTSLEPGHFRATVRHEKGGLHELILGGSDPGFAACAQLNLPVPAVSPQLPSDDSPLINAKLETLTAEAGGGALMSKVGVRLSQPDQSRQDQPMTGVKDLTLLVFDRRNAWQQRIHLQESSPGYYEGKVGLPRSGAYDWQVRSLQQAFGYQTGHLGIHEVSAQ